MLTIKPKYITDQVGNKISVVLSVKEFESMMEILEEMEDVKLYDQVKNSDDTSIPIDEAFEMVDQLREKK